MLAAVRSDSTNDAALLAALRAGDESAFTALVNKLHGRLVRLAMAFVSNRAAAEEVVQETWVGVLSGLSTFEGRSSLTTWVFKILSNRAKTRGVRDARFVPFSAFENPGEDERPAVDASRFKSNGMWADPPRRWNEDTPEELLATEESVKRVHDAIAELPAAQRAVVTLRDIEGLDAVEACNILGVSETNQRVLLHRARSKIRRALEAHLGEG